MPRPRKAAVEAALLEVEIEKAQTIKDVPRSAGEIEDGVQSLVNTTAEYVVLFSTKDGVASKIRAERLRDKLRPDRDGVVPFSVEPVNPDWRYIPDPVTGVPLKVNPKGLKCYLHPTGEHREMLEEIGLADRGCLKSNIPTPFMLQLHMERKHRIEWQSIKQHEEEVRRRTTEQQQMELLRALTAATLARKE